MCSDLLNRNYISPLILWAKKNVKDLHTENYKTLKEIEDTQKM